MQNDSEEFDRYYSFISLYSPDSHASKFPNESNRLTYWLNAYNAAAIRTVLEYYPISSVKEVKGPFWAFFLPDPSGFFIFQRHRFGSLETNLYNLENKIIRKRFSDPRIHFALNCASVGCPLLPKEAFMANKLDAQLERETQKFFSEPRNFTIDHQQKEIRVSSILRWYESDFTDWLKKHNFNRTDLRGYLKHYLPHELSLLDESYSMTFVDYDWSLNDQER